jgi:aminopeptidase
MEDPRIREFARFLINKAVYLKAGENILIELHGHETGLARALVEEAYAAEGFPFIHVFDYELERALYSKTTAKHMKQLASYELARMKDMDAYIDIRATENINVFKGIPEDGMAAYRKEYWGPIHLERRCNHTKWSVLRYPNNAMAQLAGMSTGDYEDFYFRACLLDYDKMAAAMKKLTARMDKTDKVHITGPETDLHFSIKGIPSFGMSGNRNIPDGEVYTSPVKDSVNGIISYNVPSPYEGLVFQNVRFEFKDGKIVKAAANHGEKLNKILDTDPGARYIGEFALGVNPVVREPMLDILFDEKITGSFHLTPGQAYENADNGNKSAVHWDLISIQRSEYGGGEIYFDGELIRKDGLFVPDDLHCLNPEELL